MKNKRNLLGLLFLSLFVSTNMNSQNNNELIKPNIIIFYADDLGWQDIQLNDLDEPCAWDTPNITKLAADAINFTNGYSPAPTCAPSRCGILSGLHPAKTGITNVSGGGIPKGSKRSNYISPFFPGGLSDEHLTIAEALKMNGYKTGHSGKWHAGMFGPKEQGFDFSYESRGAHQGPKNPYTRLTKFATNEASDPYRLSEEKYFPFTKASPKGISYPTDEVTESALQFIEENKDEPFFLYLAHWMVHYPIHTKNRELLDYYVDKLGVELPEVDTEFREGGQTNPYFGSMVTTLDWSLGRVVDLLKKTDDPRNPGKKLYETTYILFSSDNGGAEIRGREIMSDNAPLDKGKKYSEEGGIRVPTLITGPNVLKGTTKDVLINQLDFFPTILNLTNSEIPSEYRSDLDGLDISNVLFSNDNEVNGKDGKPREDLWWHFPYGDDVKNQSAIRSGDYKLYKNFNSGKYVLHRLYKDGKRHDLEEQHDIAEESPEILKDLSEKLEKYLKDYDAKLPAKNIVGVKDPADKEKLAFIPVVKTDTYDAESRTISIELEEGKSKVVECYALIRIGKENIKRGKKSIATTYIETPLESSKDKLSYTVKVPEGVYECGVIFVDENRFMVKSNFHELIKVPERTKRTKKKKKKKG